MIYGKEFIIPSDFDNLSELYAQKLNEILTRLNFQDLPILNSYFSVIWKIMTNTTMNGEIKKGLFEKLKVNLEKFSIMKFMNKRYSGDQLIVMTQIFMIMDYLTQQSLNLE